MGLASKNGKFRSLLLFDNKIFRMLALSYFVIRAYRADSWIKKDLASIQVYPQPASARVNQIMHERKIRKQNPNI
jgi:hypothetical protein